MKEYLFPYYNVTNKVWIDEFTIKTQQGPFVKKEFPLNDLQYFGHSALKKYEVLTFLYTDKNLKTKKIQIYSNPGGEPFKELISELDAKFPKRNLNSMNPDEAMQIIKSVKISLLKPVLLVLLIMTVLACIIAYPWLRHAIDSGYKEVSVNELVANPDIGTRNVTIYGYLYDASLEETTTTTHKGRTTTSVALFIPVVDSTWTEADPVKVFIQTGDLTQSQYEELLNETSFTGAIRNIWWEGLSSDNIDFFAKEYNLKVDKDPILIEVTGQRQNDQGVFWVLGGIMGVVVIILLIALLVTKRQQKKKLI